MPGWQELLGLVAPEMGAALGIARRLSGAALTSYKKAVLKRITPTLVRAGANPSQAYRIMGRYGLGLPIPDMAGAWNQGREMYEAGRVLQGVGLDEPVPTHRAPVRTTTIQARPSADVKVTYQEAPSGRFQSRYVNVYYREGESMNDIRGRAERKVMVGKEAGRYPEIMRIRTTSVQGIHAPNI